MRRKLEVPHWALFVLLLGAYLTVRGYHSRDGDQAYRLPLLLHQHNPAIFADDPFVRAFDTFNPHRGYLALLDQAARPLGLSFGLFSLFAATFGLLCYGVDRLARVLWPDEGPAVGLVAVLLVLLAKAGNVGTNHLFEAMLLDRLIGFSLGWVALALAMEGKTWQPAALIGVAAIVHPSVGLQLAALLGVSWIGWTLAARWTRFELRTACKGLIGLTLAILPGTALTLGQGKHLFAGLDPAEYRLLGVQLQMAQHMVPSLWRATQWLAWAGYIGVGLISIGSWFKGRTLTDRPNRTIEIRRRFAITFGLLLLGLGVAYLAVEVVGDLRVTVFQPFRMATIARGLALLAVSGRLLGIVRRGEPLAWPRLFVFAAGLAGDRGFVVAVAFEVVATVSTRLSWSKLVPLAVLAIGCFDLFKHDTESGHVGLTVAALAGWAVTILQRRGFRPSWNALRLGGLATACWVVPIAALLAPMLLPANNTIVTALAQRCRFAAVPTDDVERLAVWCQDHTEPNARFVTPPGPKTFRLWSQREVAFNRAASPYHAQGLKDWSDRFRAHVGFEGSTEAFVNGYLSDRHGFESRFAKLDENQLASLADGQGASYVLAARGLETGQRLTPVKAEGRYAIYRVEPKLTAKTAQVIDRVTK